MTLDKYYMNKEIKRVGKSTAELFDNRNLETDYATIIPLLKEGLRVLDVGCGTGAISKGIAIRVGTNGHVTGIDNTEYFILSGKMSYGLIKNMELLYADLFTYEPNEKFDLIVAARVLQWLNNPVDALRKLKSMLKPNGILSVLDYNHNAIEWKPAPPESMKKFYIAFLKWRADAGLNNQIAEDLADKFKEAGFHSIEIFNADETYEKWNDNFKAKAGIWAKVAESTQMVEEGYINDIDRLTAIADYNEWIDDNADLMRMKLNEVRGVN